MILNLKNKNLKIKNKTPLDISFPPIIKEEIKKYWNIYIKNNPNCYNGDVYSVTNITNNKNEIILEIGKIKYEDLVYNQKYLKYQTKSLYVASYFITKDNKYCLIKDSKNLIDLIGGMVDTKDFNNNILNPLNCLERELKEELGLDINSKHFIKKELKYLKIPTKKEEKYPQYTVGIIYEIKINLTSKELINIFKNNKNIIDGEILEIILIKKTNDLHKYSTKNKYLKELFKQVNKKGGTYE